MILRFVLRVGDAGERVEEPVGGVDGVQPRAGGGHEVALHLLALARAQQAVVDEHAGEAVADGALDERGGHRGVDAAGEPADRPAVADLRADGLDLLVDDRCGGPGRPAMPAISCRNRSSTCWPCASGSTSGWYCTPASRRVGVLERRDRRARSDAAVTANPSGARTRSRRGSSTPGAARAGRRGATPPSTRQLGAAVLARCRSCATVAAERQRHGLEAVADAEHRDARVEEAPGRSAARPRRTRWRAAGEDDRGGLARDDAPPPACRAGTISE